MLLGMIPFFVGDIIDIFHRANTQNMQMIQGFVDGDEAVIKQVNQRAWQSVIVLILLLLLIALMIWMLISFGSYIYSLVTSIVYSLAHCPHDLDAHILWQLHIFSCDINCLKEFKKKSA